VATVTTITTNVGYKLKDTGGTNYTAAEILVYINEAVRMLARRVAVLSPDFWLQTGQAYIKTQNVVSGTASYDLPTDLYETLKVTLTSSAGVVDPLDQLDLDRLVDSDAEGYAFVNAKLKLFPTPTASVTSGLNHYYVAIPAACTAGGDTVPLSAYFEDAISEFVVLRCKGRQNEQPPDFGTFYKLVQDQLDMMVSKTNTWDQTHGLNVEWRPYV